MEPERLLTSTLKSLALLDMLAECRRSVGVSELAEKTRTGRGTIHQRLATLAAAGWVERVEGGQYRLTLRAASILKGALQQASIGERIVRPMEELAAATSEAVSLAVLHDGAALIVQRVESGQVLRADIGVGTSMPLAASASGRVIAAFLSPGEIADLTQSGIRLPDPATLDRIRRERVELSVDDFKEGIFAVAAPLFDASGAFIGALSAAGPSSRLDMQDTREKVLQTVDRIHSVLRGEAPASTTFT